MRLANKDESRITKTVRFFLIYDGVLPYSDLCRELWACQDELRHVLNAGSTEFRIYSEWRESVKNERGGGKENYPTKAEVEAHYGCAFKTYLYQVATGSKGSKGYTQRLGSEMVTAALNSELGKWKLAAFDYLRGDKAYPSYKSDQPLVISKRNTVLQYNDRGERSIVFKGITNVKRTKELGWAKSEFPFHISAKDDGTNAILDNCINGVYEKGTASIRYDKKKKQWSCSLSFSFPRAEQQPGDRVCGVDLGIVNAAYCAVNDGYERLRIPGGKIEEFRKRVEARRRSFAKERPFAGDGSVGHGTKERVRPVFELEEKISNFRKTCNFQFAHAIVDFAKKNGCGTIQMENLSGISTGDKFLKNWTYFDLQQKIKHKAQENGIAVVEVEPRYTSQRCSKCGYIDSGNRPQQDRFCCLKCGFETNADYNAARNLSLPGIAERIAETLGADPE